MLKKIISAVVLVTTCGFAGGVMAQPDYMYTIKPSGLYFDGNLGWGKSAIQVDGGAKDKNSGLAWNINFGYKFIPHLAAQIGILGSPKVSHTGSSPGEIKGNYLLILAFKGIIPFESGFSLNILAGPAWAHTKFSTSMDIDGTSYNGSYHKITAYLGLGADYNLSENFYVGLGFNYSLKVKPVPSMYSLTGNIGYIF
jgi:opacity protein-like surface antigen